MLCRPVAQLDKSVCAQERSFHNCPFDATAESPCNHGACAGAAYVNPNRPHDNGAIQADCCHEIKSYCSLPKNRNNDEGCDSQTLGALDQLCADSATDQSPELTK